MTDLEQQTPTILNPTAERAERVAWLKSEMLLLDHALETGVISIRELVTQRADLMDQLLVQVWRAHQLPETDIALVAVGGFGRGELLPFSDVDVMVLCEDTLSDSLQEKVSQFITDLWDCAIDPAVSVRTVAECFESAHEITIATTLIESRLIVGDARIGAIPRKIVAQSWQDQTFFTDKQQEQHLRHAKHNYTEYNLEPDIKNAPGGLRDINQIGWIAKRHYRVNRMYDLVNLGFITEFEWRDLRDAEDYLWLIRYHLHRIAKRNENRLLFDYQHEVAAKMGFVAKKGDHGNAVIEQFMRSYYRVAMKVSTLNELLLAYFYESVIEAKLPKDQQAVHIDIDENFKQIGTQIAVQNHRVFSTSPEAILGLFVIMAENPQITGIRARTLRLLMISASSIDQAFRDNPLHHQQFIKILSTSPHLFILLKDMKRYGVLGRYLPAFSQITGLMQYDLFHIYTVDAHTLTVVRNLQRFLRPKYQQAFPVVSLVFERQQHKILLYLAAIFHDIAKGRGGDHSQLGAVDAIEFCLAHGFGVHESNLVGWLTQNHLLMSLTAQKQDISDLDVLEKFAHLVGDELHLDLLYCLTVADINATNPNLWNSWRGSLLRQLYVQTRRLIRAGLSTPIDQQVLIDEKKNKVLHRLTGVYAPADVHALWEDFNDDYFIREQAEYITWHTIAILHHNAQGLEGKPLVMLREQRVLSKDAVQVFIYTKDLPNLFAATVATFDQMNLNVLDARIMGNKKNYSLDTYVLLDEHHTLQTDVERQQQLLLAIQNELSAPEAFPHLVKRLTPRQLKHFSVQNEVKISLSRTGTHQVMEVMSLDTPGLLAQIGLVFMQQKVNILSAKIATLGERAEDVFYICHQDGSLLNEDECNELCRVMKEALDARQQQTPPTNITF